MYLKGTVTSVVFYNKENGYSVLQIEADSDDITAVGILPIVSVGEVLELEGEYIVHNKFGPQFSVKSFKTSAPSTKEGLIRYLSSGLIKGVGEATAKAIVNKFGLDTIKVIETSPMSLASIKGISDRKALSISNEFAELKKMQNSIMFLQGYSLSINLSIKIYNVYKENTKKILTENPYKLIDDIDGVGFITADKIAQNMGIKAASLFRIRAGIVYTLKESGEKLGNTFVYFNDLKENTFNLLNIEAAELNESFDDIISSLILEGAITVFDKTVKCVALNKYYNVEKSIAVKLIKLKNEALQLSAKVDDIINEFEQINNIKFHSNQIEAVKSAITDGVTVITGGPGTGKTTIINCISYILKTLGLKIEFTAPTGRAAKRLSESTGVEAKTIHRLLGVEFGNGRLNFLYNEFNTLNADVVIVDELSMVDVNIMNSLLRAVRQGSRLILVGDKDQLPSVGAGNVLADIIKSNLIKINYLTYIYRQSADSLIVSNAHLINQCKMPIINNDSADFFMMNQELCDVPKIIEKLVTTRLPKFSGVAPINIQILAPLKSGINGVENLNKVLQEAVNPPINFKKELYVGKQLFRVGDKVMQTVNDYEMEWTKVCENNKHEFGTGVFNGDIGFITTIDIISNFLTVEFEDGRKAEYSQKDLLNLTLSYAITIHKSQGSEFDVVIIPMVSGPPTILNKNLLYTAVTRAKKLVVLVGSSKCLAMMVKNNYIITRNTVLSDFLIDENTKYNLLFGTKYE